MEYLRRILIEAVFFLTVTLETHTLGQTCDCSRDQANEILCVGLTKKPNGSLYKICPSEPFLNGTDLKLTIRDSEQLPSLDLISDFELGISLDALSDISIVNNSRLREIRFCRSPCLDVYRRLETIDIRNNYLSDSIYPTSVFNLSTLKSVYLSGNPWSCFSKDSNQTVHKLSWLFTCFERSIIHDEPTCSKPKSDKWHQIHPEFESDSSNVSLYYFLEFFQTLQDTCPPNCTCHTININKPLLVKVSCVKLNLTKLPDTLPPNTVDLDISYNKLLSLGELGRNPDYHNLSKLRAVQNHISSLSDLKGSPFMNNRPTAINLRNNSITHFDVELLGPLLSDMRSKNFHGSVDFFFSENPLDCDCKNLTNLQQFLYEYKLYLRDADLLACGASQSPILIQIDYTQYCETSIDYMWIVIAGEVILLVLVLSRLTYDVINYRRSGELPWLAKHMYMGCTYSGLRKSTLPTFLRNSECRSHCHRDNASVHEETLRIQGGNPPEDSLVEDPILKNNKVFVLKEVFRPKGRSSSARYQDDLPETFI